MTILHSVGDWVRELLLQIPLFAARLLFVAALVSLLVWVLMLPKRVTHPEGAEFHHWSQNLKIWAALTLVIQIAIYALL